MTLDATGAALLSSAVRRDIVDTLANLPLEAAEPEGLTRERGMTAAELGGLLGLHVTTARFHLDRLIEGGLVTSHFARDERAGRPRKLYVAAPGSLSESSDTYRILAELLTECFPTDGSGPPFTPEEAGQRWAQHHSELFDPSHVDAGPARSPGGWLAKVGDMIDLLTVWGYTPSVRTRDAGRTAEIELHHCPLLPLAQSNPAVVCGIHRGLIRGAMDALGEQDTEVSLVPFVEPHLCLAQVTTRTPFAPRGGTS